MQSSTTTSYGRARAYFNAFLDVTKKNNGLATTADVQNLADAFARSEFLNNRAFGVGARTIADDIDSRSVPLSSRTDSLKNLLELDYAMTDHGSSVLSPAAYFYDLIRIVFSQINIDATSDPAKYSLLARRPDLLDIPLDNDNAEVKLFPTISIINYVLARQLSIRDDASLLPSNNSSSKPSYADLISIYENAALDKLKKLPSDVFHLPFDVDFESQLMYLFAMGKTLYELSSGKSKIMGGSLFDISPISSKYYLQLSDVVAEQLLAPAADLLSTMKDDNDTSIPVRSNFSDSKIFCKKTGISYERLGELLHLNTSDTQERRYVDAIGVENFYINQGPDPVRLALEDNSDKEWLQYLTNERLKRIGQFHFMSQKMELTADEMELVFSLVQDFDIGVLARFKQFKDEFNVSTLEAVNFLTRSTDKPRLYTAVMKNICPLPVKSVTSQIDLLKLKTYLNLLSDININIASEDLPAALQTTAYVCRMTGVLLPELVYIYADSVLKNMLSSPTMDDINIFIKSAHELGRLKLMFNRSLFELCQLVCYAQGDFLASPTIGFSKDTTQGQIISQGINLLLNGSQHVQLTTSLPYKFSREALLGLSDAEGWGSSASYYSTIKGFVVNDVVYLMARGVAGLNVYRYDAAQRSWVFVHNNTDFSDQNGWSNEQYYRTIQPVVVLSVVYFFFRGALGIVAYRYDTQANTWLLGSPTENTFGDPNGWGRSECYSTIQYVSMGESIYLFARHGSQGILVRKYNTQSNTWSTCQTLSGFTDVQRWNSPEYYSTIKCLSIGSSIYLLARAPEGIVLHSYDTRNNTWDSTHPVQADFRDAGGWNLPIYYATIRSLAVNQVIYVFARGAAGFVVYRYDTQTKAWDNSSQVLSWDPGSSPGCYSTIQYVVMGQIVYLFARCSTGILGFAYNTQTKTWVADNASIGAQTDFADCNFWNNEKYYSTIRSLVVGNVVYLFGRGASGLQLYRYVYTTRQEDRLVSYIELGRLNQSAFEQNLNSEALVLARFGILSLSQMKEVKDIQEGLLKPFFRELRQSKVMPTLSQSTRYLTSDNQNLLVFPCFQLPRYDSTLNNIQSLVMPDTRDLVFIFRQGTVSGGTEVYISSAASGYQGLRAVITDMGATGTPATDYRFLAAKQGKLFFVKPNYPTANQCQLQSVNYSPSWGAYGVVNTITLGTWSGNRVYLLAPDTNDLIVINQNQNGSPAQILVFTQSSGYQTYQTVALQNIQSLAGVTWKFFIGVTGDVYALAVRAGISNGSSLHRFAANTAYATWEVLGNLPGVYRSTDQFQALADGDILNVNIDSDSNVAKLSAFSKSKAYQLTSEYFLGLPFDADALENLEINVASLFGVSKEILHRIMNSFEDLGYAFYAALLSTSDSTTESNSAIYFMYRVASLIKLFKLESSIDEAQRLQFQSIIVELDAAAGALLKKSSQVSNAGNQLIVDARDNLMRFSEENMIPKSIRKFFKKDSSGLKNNLNALATRQVDITSPEYARFQKAFSDYKGLRGIDFDDIDVLIELLQFPSRGYTDGMFSIVDDRLRALITYKAAQASNGATNIPLLNSLWNQLTPSDDFIISQALNIDIVNWRNLKQSLSFDVVSAKSMPESIRRLNKITQIKSVLGFFEYDTSLVIAFLQNRGSTSIAQHLGQVLAKKDPDAYDKATRRLAERKRDALVDAVLRQFSTDEYSCFNLKNADKLSEYLLIDVSISGEDTQTAISQAHSTLQWYLRRCVEGVERDSYTGLTMSVNIRRAWWNWIQNYRVWEANRQVFLYSENFLSPDLRVNQSEQFKQFAKILRQPHLDDEAIENAYLQYVKEVMNFRNVAFSAACVEPQAIGSTTRKMHFFGHDNAVPKQYYHCSAEQDMTNAISISGFSYEFLIAQDGSDDVFYMRKNNTISGKIEVYILGGGHYTDIRGHFVTPLDVVTDDNDYQFMVAQNRDLYWLNKGTATNQTQTQIAILSAASKYKTVTDPVNIGRQRQPDGFGSYKNQYYHFFLMRDTNDILLVIDWPDNPMEVDKFPSSNQYATWSCAGTPPAQWDWSDPTKWKILIEPGTNDLVGALIDTHNGSKVELNYLVATGDVATNYSAPRRNVTTNFARNKSQMTFLFKSNKDLVQIYLNDSKTYFGVRIIRRTGVEYQTDDWVSDMPLLAPSSRNVTNTFRNWTFWEKLPLNISESEGRPLSAIFTNNRSYLYWLQKTELSSTLSLPSGNVSASSTVASGPQTQIRLFCSYQHVDGSWQAPQLLDKTDWAGFFPGVDYTDSTKADQLTFDPVTIRITVDNHGRYNSLGNYDPNPYQLRLMDDFWVVQWFPDVFSVLLDMLYQKLNTQTIENAVRLDLSSLSVFQKNCLFDPDTNLFKPGMCMAQDSLWGQYYWELMYFVPLTMANALQVSQQYDKALTWYQVVFDPSQRGQGKPSFIFPPFTSITGNDVLTHLLNTQQLTDMHSHAFEAHRMATLFGSLPYKKYVVIQYIRSLLAWGDSFFTSNTRETITEAIGRYLAVSDLLGDSPRALYSAQYDRTIQHKMLHELIPSSGYACPNVSGAALTNASLNKLVIFPYNYTVSSYFHVPENREFMGLWTQVSDRLYKIRHCLSIDGIKQQLALYSPPIDPHELVRAVAVRGGEFVREMLTQISGANRSPYRFLVLLERAKEFAGYVERLGDSLLSILERQDSAGLVKLNNEFAQTMLDAVTDQKIKAHSQAVYDRQMLDRRQTSIQTRIDYYTGLLPHKGMSDEDISAEVLLGTSAALSIALQGVTSAVNFAGTLPQFGSPFALTYGGEQVKFAAAIPIGMLTAADIGIQYTAGALQRAANYKNRCAEWQLQLSLAKKELEELGLQQRGADLRIDVAAEDLRQHKLSIEHQRNLTLYNNNQFTNLDLYTWYADQLYDLLGNAYNLALRVANQAAAAYQYEVGTASSVSLNGGFWANSRKGLLSGPKLSQRLHEMQQEYLEKNKRVPEVEKVFSLRDVLLTQQNKDWPTVLASLLTPAGISFTLGADLFKDFFHGTGKTLVIKMISVTVPALASPNQQVNLILTHQSSGEQIYISRGMSATGMFSSSMDDARYLPFEGRTIDDNTSWTLSIGNASLEYLTDGIKSLYNSITDIQLRVYYQIRQASPSMSL